MTHRMKDTEIRDASEALIDWLESQDLDPENAVPVLTTTLIALIHEIAVNEGRNAKDGGRIIANIIMRGLP